MRRLHPPDVNDLSVVVGLDKSSRVHGCSHHGLILAERAECLQSQAISRVQSCGTFGTSNGYRLSADQLTIQVTSSYATQMHHNVGLLWMKCDIKRCFVRLLFFLDLCMYANLFLNKPVCLLCIMTWLREKARGYCFHYVTLCYFIIHLSVCLLPTDRQYVPVCEPVCVRVCIKHTHM